MRHLQSGQRLFRLWIATYEDWRPSCWGDVPPRATAVELVEDAAFSAVEAALFLEGFNSAMLGHDRAVWAVAVPVAICYEGDTQPGARVSGFVFADDLPAPASA